jgi:hypothetical protein
MNFFHFSGILIFSIVWIETGALLRNGITLRGTTRIEVKWFHKLLKEINNKSFSQSDAKLLWWGSVLLFGAGDALAPLLYTLAISTIINSELFIESIYFVGVTLLIWTILFFLIFQLLDYKLSQSPSFWYKRQIIKFDRSRTKKLISNFYDSLGAAILFGAITIAVFDYSGISKGLKHYEFIQLFY